MDSTTLQEENRLTTHHSDDTTNKPKARDNEWVIREDQTPTPNANNNLQPSMANTETEAIMRYIELLERTQTFIQKTERIMDKLSGQLGSAIAETENQVKSRKPLAEKMDGGNSQVLDGCPERELGGRE